MRALYQEAIDGTLTSTEGTEKKLSFKNALPIWLMISWVSPTSRLVTRAILKPGETAEYQSREGYAYVFFAANSGIFVAAYRDVAGVAAVTIDESLLCRPNDIGHLPQPSKDRPIPTDSMGVTVGIGSPSTGLWISRHQYWRLSPDSYVLASGEERVVSFQETSGRQQTSSSQEVVAEALGMSASGGWGPISASISANLNRTTTTMQQVAISSESVRYESVTLRNQTADTVMYLMWQLMDVITVFKADKPVAQIPSSLRPVLLAGPYDPSNLPSSTAESSAPLETAPAFIVATDPVADAQ